MKISNLLVSLLISTAALLGACGGGGGGSSDTSTTASAPVTSTTLSECHQLTAGNKLLFSSAISPSSYAQTTTVGTLTSVVTTNWPQVSTTLSIQLATFNSVNAVSGKRISSQSLNGIYQPTGTFETFYNITPAVYQRLGTASSSPGSTVTSLTTFNGYTRDITKTAGTNQVTTYTTGTSTVTNVVSLTFVGIEDVLTPAGIFKNACKMTATYFPVTTNSVFVSDTFWYAPGFGNVKEVSVETFSDGRVPSTFINTTQATALLNGSL